MSTIQVVIPRLGSAPTLVASTLQASFSAIGSMQLIDVQHTLEGTQGNNRRIIFTYEAGAGYTYKAAAVSGDIGAWLTANPGALIAKVLDISVPYRRSLLSDVQLVIYVKEFSPQIVIPPADILAGDTGAVEFHGQSVQALNQTSITWPAGAEGWVALDPVSAQWVGGPSCCYAAPVPPAPPEEPEEPEEPAVPEGALVDEFGDVIVDEFGNPIVP